MRPLGKSGSGFAARWFDFRCKEKQETEDSNYNLHWKWGNFAHALRWELWSFCIKAHHWNIKQRRDALSKCVYTLSTPLLRISAQPNLSNHGEALPQAWRANISIGSNGNNYKMCLDSNLAVLRAPSLCIGVRVGAGFQHLKLRFYRPIFRVQLS